MHHALKLVFAVLSTLLVLSPASAQEKKPAPDRCLALASLETPLMRNRSFVLRASLKPYQARLTYHGHSTFTLESPKGITVTTDYNDYIRPPTTPVIATMNVAHDTHFSLAPDPKIKHILRGWDPEGKSAAIHDLTVQDLRVRNIPTNIRNEYGTAVTGRFGNSIFVFEVGGLCIAHLGHLHHTLTTQQLAQIGQMDVVMVPIDGTYTLDVTGMIEVLKTLKAPMIIPMHYFSEYSLQRFLDAAKGAFPVVRNPTNTLVVSRDQMPPKPQVVVLPPG